MLTACAQDRTAEPPGPPAPPGQSAETADADRPGNPLLSLTSAAGSAADGRPEIELLVTGLRTDERAVELRLDGPENRSVVASSDAILHGSRLTGNTASPRVGLTGGSNEGIGVTLSLDLFGRRSQRQPEPAEALRAWAKLTLPEATDPVDWTASAIIEDRYGRRQRLVVD
ncbi:hypothetical protein [Algihabitans albus]|uniref:hypothetical protein n=1 Tax=Algihabitans albus TaxID=2164067 RepID=UPI0013C29FDE|nr:hypothetical protein [Algihabitans albus]